MRFLPTGEQMQKAERYTIEKTGVSSLMLMERAAQSVVDVIEEYAINLSSILIVCGSGNNGDAWHL